MLNVECLGGEQKGEKSPSDSVTVLPAVSGSEGKYDKDKSKSTTTASRRKPQKPREPHSLRKSASKTHAKSSYFSPRGRAAQSQSARQPSSSSRAKDRGTGSGTGNTGGTGGKSKSKSKSSSNKQQQNQQKTTPMGPYAPTMTAKKSLVRYDQMLYAEFQRDLDHKKEKDRSRSRERVGVAKNSSSRKSDTRDTTKHKNIDSDEVVFAAATQAAAKNTKSSTRDLINQKNHPYIAHMKVTGGQPRITKYERGQQRPIPLSARDLVAKQKGKEEIPEGLLQNLTDPALSQQT